MGAALPMPRVGPATIAYLTGAERRRAIEAESRAAKAEAGKASADRIAETVALSEARGAEFTGKGDKARPVRRLSGLEALAKAGKLKGRGLEFATAYGVAFREAHFSASLQSSLANAGGARSGLDPDVELAAIMRKDRAALRLKTMRHDLGFQPDLIRAADAVFGREETPREAGGNANGSGVYTALALVAADLLSGLPGTR